MKHKPIILTICGQESERAALTVLFGELAFPGQLLVTTGGRESQPPERVVQDRPSLSSGQSLFLEAHLQSGSSASKHLPPSLAWLLFTQPLKHLPNLHGPMQVGGPALLVLRRSGHEGGEWP